MTSREWPEVSQWRKKLAIQIISCLFNFLIVTYPQMENRRKQCNTLEVEVIELDSLKLPVPRTSPGLTRFLPFGIYMFLKCILIWESVWESFIPGFFLDNVSRKLATWACVRIMFFIVIMLCIVDAAIVHGENISSRGEIFARKCIY